MNYDKIPNEIFDEARGIVALEGGWAEVKLKHGKRVLDELIKESLNREIQIIMNDPELMKSILSKKHSPFPESTTAANRIRSKQELSKENNREDKKGIFKPISRTNFGIRTGYLADNFDLKFLKWFYQGLDIANPSGEIFERMNIDEGAALCAGVYIDQGAFFYNNELVKKMGTLSESQINDSDIYGLVSHYISKGMPSLRKRKTLLQEYAKMDLKANPYKQGLKERLENLDENVVKTIKKKLTKEPCVYISWGQYKYAKAATRDPLGSRNFKNWPELKTLDFLTSYKSKNANYKRLYATEIMRILKKNTENLINRF